jgi:alpha-1,2-mannosyltransferase
MTGRPATRWSHWLRRLDGISDGRLFLVIAAPLLVLYLATATWGAPSTTDPYSNVLSAWTLGTHGTFFLEDHEQLADPDYYRNVAWVIPAGDSAANKYPPGATLLAAPLYAVWPAEARLVTVSGAGRPDVAPVEILSPPLAPAAITVSLVVAAAIGLLGVAFRRLGGTPGAAMAAAFVGGLGTSAWSVAADQLWQHGPGMLWIALALALNERHTLASGFAFGAAVLTRPPTALIAAATGLYRAWRERSIRIAILIGIGAGAGIALLIAYNELIFGSPSISGGYGTSFQQEALSGDLAAYAKNVFLGLFSASHGFLIWSPFLLVLMPGLREAWKAAPSWVRGAALGGVLYLLLQYKANVYRGGDGFFAYRYPLEALTAAAPLLYLSYREWVAPRVRAVKAFTALASVSVLIHGLGAVLG